MSEDANLTREGKAEFLRNRGMNPYPTNAEDGTHIGTYLARYSALQPDQRSLETEVIAGRVVGMRDVGSIGFIDIMQEHSRVQLYLHKDALGESYDILFKGVDRGDWICASGKPYRTRRGELSLEVGRWSMMCKAARELPFGKVDKDGKVRYSATDPELLRRWPEIRLAIDPVAYAAATKRSKLITAVREYYAKHCFLEMPIPIIEREYGGASAKPFLTRVNAISGMELPLRISHELTLKRLAVAGFPRVYHLGPAFRNEGIDADHHPEFQLVESYAFNQDYFQVMEFFENLVAAAFQKVNGTTKARFGPNKMDFAPPWRRVTMVDSLKEFGSVDVTRMSDLEMMALAARCNPDVLERCKINPGLPDGELVERVLKETELPIRKPRGLLIAYLFEQIAEPRLTQPTFVYDHPKETTPLCKKHRDPRWSESMVERFEAFAGANLDPKGQIVGSEIANAYTELNDPIEQRRRMEEQARERDAGDEESYPAPEEFIQSIEYGLPPFGGLGFGLDRLAMILTGDLFPPESPPRIQETIFFPVMKPLTKQ